MPKYLVLGINKKKKTIPTGHFPPETPTLHPPPPPPVTSFTV